MAVVQLVDILKGGAYVTVTDDGAAINFDTAADVVKTTDPRLNDSRTPDTHSSTHSVGGSDPLTAADIGAATAGVFTDVSDGMVPTPGAPLGMFLADDQTWKLPVAGTVGAGALLEQPALQGFRTEVLDITAAIAGGTYTLDTNYDDFAGTLVADVVITVPNVSGHRWSPMLELSQGGAGDFAVSFKDGDGDTIAPMAGTMPAWVDAGSVNVHTLFHSETQNMWAYALINQFAPPAAPTASIEYDMDSQTPADAPNGITSWWRADNLSMGQDSGYSDPDVRRNYIKSEPDSNTFRAFGINAAGNPSDVEILALVRDDGATSSYNSTVWLRGDNSGGSSGDAYGAGFMAGSTLRVYRVSSNLAAVISDAAFATSIGEEYWIRFRAEGETLKAKAWKYGDAEPASWMVEASDNRFSSGFIGYGTYQKQNPHRLCHFAWRTDGGTVALP